MSSVNGCFNPNSFGLGNLHFLVGSQGYIFFNGQRVCPRLMVALTQFGQFVLFYWIMKVSGSDAG